MPSYPYSFRNGAKMPWLEAATTGPDGRQRHREFLVDSGAAHTQIPHSWCATWYEKNQAREEEYGRAANGQPVRGVRAEVKRDLAGFPTWTVEAWVVNGPAYGLLGQSGIFAAAGVVFRNFASGRDPGSFTIFRRPRSTR
jgi:hypothetical protein